MTTKKIQTLRKNNGYYFPLFNLIGMKSSISPYFGGDLKLDYHHYALEPTTEVDLYSNIFSRNVIFDIEGKYYFLNGQTSIQQHDRLIYETDLLFQKVTRSNKLFSIETTSYVPLEDNVEVHQIILKNLSSHILPLQVSTAIPIYGRSADNLRDHRHVTSLLNKIEVIKSGIIVQPTLSFDERGHVENDTIYSVFADSTDMKINGYIPTFDKFIDGGSLHFPKGLKNILDVGSHDEGFEAMGAIQFEKVFLQPDASITFYISIGIHQDKKQAIEENIKYLNQDVFERELKASSEFFKNYVNSLKFNISNEQTSNQLNWVVLQPMLRRYFGNSYLPHHDYGHGGRGWRDLWQDLLALIMMNDDSVYELLYNNFQGVRIDGSNATIIGDQPGEFKADRNMITRVWSDHGAWPLLTTKMYIDETGDLEFLLKKQFYFMDQFTHYTKKTQKKPSKNILIDEFNEPYYGTILEHLLLQNLVGHHNTGKHGFVRLEDADWNDGLDMAQKQGETIAFTHMYADNLRILAQLIKKLPTNNIVLFEEMLILLESEVNIQSFFDQVAKFKGQKIWIDKFVLAKTLEKLAQLRIKHLQNHAYLNNQYQSYFNDEGNNPDDDDTIALTGQAMALLSKTPSKKQARQLAYTTKKMLFDKKIGGYHLNSNYRKLLTNMGRAYGFAYGQKENGAIFSHMVIMYAYGLYQYDLVTLGHEAAFTLLEQAQNHKSKVLLGIPEYFNNEGIGKYPYLTGSASWMLKLLRSEIFGISLDLGILTLKPKLRKNDFFNKKAEITTFLFKKLRTVTYHNLKNLDYGSYVISKVTVNGNIVNNEFNNLDGNIEVYLDEKI
ncbi:MAG: cellobiose phosphorylase [Firmicutes bacterium]|nr:cellobiose phosphorylase [Bacillota bacterium]